MECFEEGGWGRYLEMLHVNDVESHDRCEKSDICLCDFFSVIERSVCHFTQMFLDLIQASEQCLDGFLVCFLCGCESGFVDAVVDIIIRPFVRGFNLRL